MKVETAITDRLTRSIVSVDGVTVGRQIEEGDILLVDIPESHARKLRKLEMTPVEEEVYEELLSIHRKNDHFWGR